MSLCLFICSIITTEPLTDLPKILIREFVKAMGDVLLGFEILDCKKVQVNGRSNF